MSIMLTRCRCGSGRIENAVCATGRPYGMALPVGDVPDMTDVIALASSGSDRAKAFAREALTVGPFYRNQRWTRAE